MEDIILDECWKLWRGDQTGKGSRLKICRANALVGSSPTRATKYTYLLGVYLGDGHISKCARTHRLRIFCHREQINVKKFCKDALEECFPNNKISIYNKNAHDKCDVVAVYSKLLPELFPQHGKGSKHTRKITLEDWQQELIDLYPKAFIMGLLHSDGSFFIRTVGKYKYPSFQFTNKSLDIHNLFYQTLDRLDIRYKMISRGNGIFDCSIAKREDVNKILTFWVGK